MSAVAAVVLAAGCATRFGSPKQRRFLPPVLDALRAASSVGEIIVVAGAYELEADARVVRCEDWELGPGASLRCGLRDLDPGVGAAVVALADGPSLDSRAVERVVAAWRERKGERLAATYDGVNRSHPVLLGREAWAAIPDEGARALEVVLVPCADLVAPGDVDHDY